VRSARRKSLSAVFVVGTAGLILMTGVPGAAALTNAARTTAAPASVPAGYTVVEAAPVDAANGLQSDAGATCPGKTRPVAGGASVGSTSREANISSSYPNGKNGWAVAVNNASGADIEIQAYAVCVTWSAAKFKIVTANFASRAGAQSSGRVVCAHGVVVGGGVHSASSNTGVNVNGLYPDTTTSWHVDVNNASVSPGKFSVWAICATKAPAHYSRVVGATEPNLAGSQTLVGITCPGSSVPLSGGVKSSAGNFNVNVNDSLPKTQGWISYENNPTTFNFNATGYAICAGS
jgi:hypothetical protein